MSSLADPAANFLLNAAWQVAAVAASAALASRLLARAPARQSHLLWVAALVASVVLPFSSLFTSAWETPPPTISVIAGAPRTQVSTANAAAVPPVVSAATDDGGPAVESLIRRRALPVSGAGMLSLVLAAALALPLFCRLAWLLRAWLRAARLRRTAYARELPAPVLSAAARCRAALGLRRRVEIICSPLASAPVTVGVRRPAIILPESLYEERCEETLASVLGHEMAHVSRRDYAVNLACELLLLPVCFHPLAHLIKRRIGRARELACDELVAAHVLPADAYARALVRVAGSLAPRPGSAVALGVFDEDVLEERIVRLTRRQTRSNARAARLLAAAAAVILCLPCLSLSTFSFELRASDAAGSALVNVPAQRLKTGGGPRVDDASLRTEPPAREESVRGETPRTDLAQALASDDPQARAQAACEAGRTRSLELIPALVSMLGDDTPVRPATCWGFGNWSPALATFKRPTPGEQAAIALASMGPPSFRRLAEALDDANGVVRRNAAWAVGELTDMPPRTRAGAVPRLVALLGDADEWVRMAAARALGELRDGRAAGPLAAALSDGEWRVRELAAWSLGEMRDAGAVEKLCGALVSDARAEVRTTAAWALGEIQDARAAGPLRQALDDPEPRVRAKARWALSEIEGDDGP